MAFTTPGLQRIDERVARNDTDVRLVGEVAVDAGLQKGPRFGSHIAEHGRVGAESQVGRQEGTFGADVQVWTSNLAACALPTTWVGAPSVPPLWRGMIRSLFTPTPSA